MSCHKAKTITSFQILDSNDKDRLISSDLFQSVDMGTTEDQSKDGIYVSASVHNLSIIIALRVCKKCMFIVRQNGFSPI